jgi:antitoxin component YwqK of YwqJK toxin-antitoxin module
MIRAGDRVGDWGEWHEDGTASARGTYVHGKRHGPWTFWGRDAQVLNSGEYLYGTKEGEWVETGEDGERISVLYRGGKKYGLRRVWYPDGSALKTETMWYADVRDGPTRTRYEDGQLESRGRYTKNQPVGLWEYWHQDGSADEERTGIVDDSGCP